MRQGPQLSPLSPIFNQRTRSGMLSSGNTPSTRIFAYAGNPGHFSSETPLTRATLILSDYEAVPEVNWWPTFPSGVAIYVITADNDWSYWDGSTWQSAVTP